MKRGMKIICLRRRMLAAAGFGLAAFLMCWAAAGPQAVGAAAAARQLPIYCVQTDRKEVALTFDAAWGDVRVRR